MKIRIQPAGFTNPQVFADVQSVVVHDDQDNPVYVGVSVANDVMLQEKAGGPGFKKLLDSLGIGLNTSFKVTKV